MRIRAESAADIAAVHSVNAAAFPAEDEARLVDALRSDGDLAISLVAEDEDGIAGHVAFSAMHVEMKDGMLVPALGLGPVATLPDRQKQGIASALVRAGLEQAREDGATLVFVMGDPDFYRRFGFTTEAARAFTSPYAGPYLLALAFDATLDLSSGGKADYARAFSALGE